MPAPSRTASATFHLTHNCNLRCTYCYTGEKFGVGMAPETADRAVDFAIREAGRQGADHLEIVFFGGEPLLRREILYRVVDRARERAGELELSFKLSTNGLFLTDDVVDALREREVYVSISIDGDPEVQDRQRPDHFGAGTSTRLDAAVGRLLVWNPCANVNCVITPESCDRVERSVRWLYDRGFRYISTTLDYSGDWSRGDLRRLEASYRRLAAWYVDATLDGAKFYLSCFDERIRGRTRGPLDKSERCSLG